MQILTEPKNSLVRQYQALFELDGIELKFDEEALGAIADRSMERKTGARGLRSIMEETMRDVMYEIPSNPKIAKCIITKATVEGLEKPEVIIDENKKEKTKKVKREKTEAKETA